ncbi:MAG: hypothetical protein JRJ04_18000 [Deltaproteobacteria bacterium]|nr:hypothetical protein [Deltaproteobacteria bacterium]
MKKGKSNRPVLEQEITLQSSIAQNLLSLVKPVSIALYEINVRLPKAQGKKMQEAIDNEILKPMAADLKREIEQAQALCAENGVNSKVAFTDPLTREITLSYPGVRPFLKLILDFDLMMIWMHKLWFAALINDDQLLETRREWGLRFERARKKIVQMSKNTRESQD